MHGNMATHLGTHCVHTVGSPPPSVGDIPADPEHINAGAPTGPEQRMAPIGFIELACEVRTS